ncbi:hypothetical protein [Yinghuangia seranimata]|uniref:hypothetical protein n=1 Tax=Yinghuangia seranimata TaxID=408067 RepID=UPI00248C8E4E|nr:hypothetical protein [Yinghuangia seranimata]MDI2127780.1 hypothetical protein [Yinghuangia seranimata]
MPENNELDPAASTQMFRAFVAEERSEAAAPAGHGGRSAARSGGMSPAVIGGIVVALIAVVVVAVLALS